MESRSHFLMHFLPGILLGSVVGLAFGSLWVASMIPQSTTGSKNNRAVSETTISSEETRWKDGPLNISFAADSHVAVSMVRYPLAYWLNDYADAEIDTTSDWTGDWTIGKEQPMTYSAKVSSVLESMVDECSGSATDKSKADLTVLGEIATKLVSAALTPVSSSFDDASLVYGYSFSYTEPSQSPHNENVYVIRNIPGFTSLDEFKQIFDVCAVGGIYPVDMSADWLVFSSSCGSGYSDASGLPNGCDEAGKAIKITVK